MTEGDARGMGSGSNPYHVRLEDITPPPDERTTSVEYVADKHELASRLLQVVEPNDVVITLGAGDVIASGRALVEEILRGSDT